MNKRTKEQLEGLFGKSARSDHAPGSTIRYQDGDTQREGEILHTWGTGPVREGGPVLKSGHIVESGRGWPKFVPLKDVVE